MTLSSVLPLLVIFSGGYLLIKLRFFFLIHPMKCIRDFLSENKSRESRRSLFLALAGTLGVGNIFGVAAGIIYGGAGSVFWLAVSSVFAAVLKYSECVLSFDSLSDGSGGMHLVLKKSFPRRGKLLSVLYAIACALLALFMGGAMQAAAVSGAFAAISEKNVLLPSIIFAVLVLFGVLGGGDKIEKITEKVIPVTMIVYISLCFFEIFRNFSSLGGVLSDIINDAKSVKGAAFGIGAFLTSKQFTEGLARGILSNESGCGTSSFAHTRASNRTPYIAGLSGICEVIFDTSVLCIMTALAILSSGVDYSSYTSPMLLVSDTVGSCLGDISRVLLLLSVAAFAYSTVVCWYYYGGVCSDFLLPRFGSRVFAPLFFAFLVFGCNILPRRLIEVTDILLLILSVLTVSAIVKRRERIKLLTLSKGGS